MVSVQASASFTNCNEILLVKSGHAYFDLLEKLIAEAKISIHLQTYIFGEDETGTRIVKSLVQAAQRNVKVYVVLDGYASQDLSKEFTNKLVEAGIHFRWFGAFLKNKYFYVGRRLHHKVVVVDNEHGLVGGINVSDHYNDTTLATAWLDYAVHIRGEAVLELQSICEQKTVRSGVFFGRKRVSLPTRKQNSALTNSIAGVRVNDWVLRKKEITDCYMRMLLRAESRVIIMSPYFIPGNRFMKSLIQAANRGVQIQLILAGVSDVNLAKHAERYIYKRLFVKNIQIYEYQKKVMHGKISTCDGQWVTVGSYNINNISAYASIELNLEIQDSNFAKVVSNELTDVIQNDCKLITEADFKSNTGLFERVKQRSAYDIFRLLFFMFTFYFKQHRE
jgi:cardiolipin synthase